MESAKTNATIQAFHKRVEITPSIGLTLGHAGNFVSPWKNCDDWKLLQILKGSVLFFVMDGSSWSWKNEKDEKIYNNVVFLIFQTFLADMFFILQI